MQPGKLDNKKNKELVEKLELMLPKELTVDTTGAESRKSVIPDQDIYTEFDGFGKLKPEVRQLFVTAF